MWALGFITVTDVLLKNYPEKEFGVEMCEALAKAVDLDYSTLKADASKISDWAAGKSADDVSDAMRGEGGSERECEVDVLLRSRLTPSSFPSPPTRSRFYRQRRQGKRVLALHQVLWNWTRQGHGDHRN